MATGNITVTTAAVFIPEIWMPEVRAFLKSKLVAANLVKKFNFVGKAGDTLHVPDISELSAVDKVASTDLTFEVFTESEFTMAINKHKAARFLIEDIVATQSAYDLRVEYTRSAGYALAKKIDSDLLALYTGLSQKYIGSTALTAWSSSTTGNGTDLTEAGIRQAIEYLDAADVPSEDRYLVIPPSQKNVLLGIARFTELQTYGDAGPIHTGEFGEIFGVKVYVTTQAPSLFADDATTAYKVSLLFQRDAFALAMQKDVRVQAQYAVEKLGWKVVCDTIYGVSEFRDNHAVALYSPA